MRAWALASAASRLFVLERQRSGGRDSLDEQRVLLQRAMVDERRYEAALALDHRGQLLPTPLAEARSGSRPGRRRTPVSGIQYASAQRRVAERAR